MSAKRDPGLDPHRSEYLSECVRMVAACDLSNLHLLVDAVEANLERFDEEHKGRDERQDALARDLRYWAKKYHVTPGSDPGSEEYE